MRTKQVDGVVRLDVVQLTPRPEVYLVYDGLGGLSRRPILQDVLEEIARKGVGEMEKFLDALDRRGSGDVHVYFHDYVSYGIGGGDATSEFFFGRFLVLWHDAKHPFHGVDTPADPELVLQRPDGIEHYSLGDYAAGVFQNPPLTRKASGGG